MPKMSSTQWAQRQDLLSVWDPRVAYPAFEEMQDLHVVTHVQIERAVAGGFHYLHESGIAQHRNRLHVVWAAHREGEMNHTGEQLRGSTSDDGGITWTPARTVADAQTWGGRSYNHPVIATLGQTLWGFFTRWDDNPDPAKNRTITCCDEPGMGPVASMVVARFDDVSQQWQQTDSPRLANFIPFGQPIKLRDGNWLISGEDFWYEAAVAISHGDDWTRWDLVRIGRAEGMTLQFPETAVIDQGDRLLAVCRPDVRKHSLMETAPASISTDHGRSWSTLAMSNLPLAPAQPYGGTLSTGQHYLITNNLEEARALLTIAVTKPGGKLFERVWKIRHQQWPRRRLFPGYWIDNRFQDDMVGKPTEWSYPAAIEHQGRLIISYTQGKEDCCCSIIPVQALRCEA